MSTAAFPGIYRPEFVNGNVQSVPSLSQGNPEPKCADLTIHRITETHHGRTLLMLGHAAEYLANSRMYSSDALENGPDDEAIHILLEASRRVFEDFAGQPKLRRSVGSWVKRRVSDLFD